MVACVEFMARVAQMVEQPYKVGCEFESRPLAHKFRFTSYTGGPTWPEILYAWVTLRGWKSCAGHVAQSAE